MIGIQPPDVDDDGRPLWADDPPQRGWITFAMARAIAVATAIFGRARRALHRRNG